MAAAPGRDSISTASRPLLATATVAPAPSSSSTAICWLISLSSVSRIRAPRSRAACVSSAVPRRSSPPAAKTLTSVSTIIDLVTGFSRNPSSCSRSASSRTSSRPNAVTSTIAGWCASVSSLLMCRLACRPSMPGIRQSMKTMS